MLEKVPNSPSDSFLDKPCYNPEHQPPSHIVLEPGTYKHTCPGCGKFQYLTVDFNQVSWTVKSDNGYYQEMERCK